MRNILLLGDYSGRNTGHNSHLLSVCHELQQALGPCQIQVPTLAPESIDKLINNISHIKPFGVAPWHGSLKFMGLPVMRALRDCDLIVLADNMFYDNHLWHPLKNNLFALSWLAGRARRRRIPVVYLNAGVGPARYKSGRYLIRHLAGQMDLTTLRDQESAKCYRDLTGINEITVTADSGFNMPWSDLGASAQVNKSLESVAAGSSDLIGVNLSRHMEHWLMGLSSPQEREQYLHNFALTLENVAKEMNARIVFLVTHSSDRKMTDRVLSNMKSPSQADVLIEDGQLIWKLVRNIHRFQWLLGTRYHEIVLFASAGIPVLGLNCGEKLDGLFTTLNINDALLDVEMIGNDGGSTILLKAVDHAQSDLAGFQELVSSLAQHAMAGANSIKQLYVQSST